MQWNMSHLPLEIVAKNKYVPLYIHMILWSRKAASYICYCLSDVSSGHFLSAEPQSILTDKVCAVQYTHAYTVCIFFMFTCYYKLYYV